MPSPAEALRIVGSIPTQSMDVHMRFEVFTAITVNNAVLWDINLQFVPHRKHVKFPLQCLIKHTYTFAVLDVFRVRG
jgi:hypothetical protein